MKREFSLEFCRATEAAALACHKWLGKGNNNIVFNVSAQAMHTILNNIKMSGRIVIAETPIDNAPKLYLGEQLGLGGDSIDIAVIPVDGINMATMGQSNVVSVLLACDKGGFFRSPKGMYMENLIVGPSTKGVIDLNLSFEDNIKLISKAIGKPLYKRKYPAIFHHPLIYRVSLSQFLLREGARNADHQQAVSISRKRSVPGLSSQLPGFSCRVL